MGINKKIKKWVYDYLFIKMVRRAGLEPAMANGRLIYSQV